MPNGSHAPLSTQRPRNGEAQPAPPQTPSEPATTKRDLTSWWKQFKGGKLKKEEEKVDEPRGIFGVPLITSIPYANVAISLFNETGESYIYGYVPIVVAKCGVFLKEKATDVEGIFRLAGSEKRIKELRLAFDTPPRWGKGLDWTGYTVHDAANILRRYFNQLPEPIIPLKHYEPFRNPLRGHQAEAVGALEGQSPSIGGFNPDIALRVYQQLIKELPSLNRQLLLYILDLLAVFAAKSDINKMTTSNLAAIFQPGILSHPQHDMAPHEYRLSQDVLIFLIDNQDHFLIGMEGTAVDANTVKHIESGPGTPQVRTPSTPGRNKAGIGRSASNSSAGAESLRKFGGIRRNVSTSSRHSRNSGALPSPITPSMGTPPGTGVGVHRSNTVPSKKSPAIPGARFNRDKHSDPPTPAPEEEKTQTTAPPSALEPESNRSIQPEAKVEQVPATLMPAAPVPPRVSSAQASQTTPTTQQLALAPVAAPPASPGVISPSSSEDSTPRASIPNADLGNVLVPPAAMGSQAQGTSQGMPTKEKSESLDNPPEGGDPVTPGSEFAPTARTFTQIFARASPTSEEKKDTRKPNKLQKKRIPSSTIPSAHSSTHSLTGQNVGVEGPPSPLPPGLVPGYPVSISKEALQGQSNETTPSRQIGHTLKPSMSPSASFRSHSTATEYSEADPPEEPLAAPEKKKEKGHWGFSHKREKSAATPSSSENNFGSIAGADRSVTSFNSSSGGFGRRSLQYDSHQGSDISSLSMVAAGEEKKGHFNWFRRHDRKEREGEKQKAKSPPDSTTDLGQSQNLVKPTDSLPVRGKSMEISRPTTSEESSDVTPTGTSPIPTQIQMTTTAEPSKPQSETR